MVIVRRIRLLAACSAAAVIAIGTAAVIDWRCYHVSLLSPGSLPAQVQACGRNFRMSDTTATDRATAQARHPGMDPFVLIATVHPLLHRLVQVLGRPALPHCGMVLLAGTDDAHLADYELMGGP